MGILSQNALSDDLTTLSGTTYHGFTVVKAENGFLTINYVDGTATIKAEALPQDIRQQYGLTLVSQKPPKNLDKIVLNDGTIYLNVTIVNVQPDSLTILYKDGGAKIPFENLPDDICKLYDLTVEGAQQYRASLKQEQESADTATTASTNADNPPPVLDYTSAPSYNSGGNTVYVHGYYRKDGTYVNGYTRNK